LKLRVERVGGIGAFAKPLGGEVELDDLPDSLAADVRETFTPDLLRERSRAARPESSKDRVEGQTITVRVWEHDESAEFSITDDDPDVDLFDLSNAIVNELVRRQVDQGASPEVSGDTEPNPAPVRAYDAVFFDIGSMLVSPEQQWTDGARRALDQLHDRKISVGVISNTGDLTREAVLDLLPVDFDFDRFDPALVLLSSEVGIEKPDERIFSLAVERAGTEPSRCLFCGEDLAETVAAQQVGLHAIRLAAETAADFATLIELVDG
jgi:putative hydrolase of the HAD superfamily